MINKLSKNFNIFSFLEENNIEYSLTGEMVTKNYIGIKYCPFCGKGKTHSGIHKERKNFYCWVCGGHSLFDYIKKILDLENKEVFSQLLKFQTNKIPDYFNTSFASYKIDNKKYSVSNCTLPSGIIPKLDYRFKKYLKKRKYPLSIIKKYNIKNTNEIGDFCHRLIFPFYKQNKLVTYTGRSISKKTYKDCPIEKSIIPPKQTLYNFDNLSYKTNCLIVEGIFDCLRIGDNCVATSGVSFSDNQIRLLLSKKPLKVYVCYDTEPEAQNKARKLCEILSLYTFSERIELESDDIGSLSNNEGNELRNELKLKGKQF